MVSQLRYVSNPIHINLDIYFTKVIDEQEIKGDLKRYHITRLPNYLIFHVKRFTKNNWAKEKNPTIVNFPIKGVDLSECKRTLTEEIDSVTDA